MTAVK